MKKHILVMAVMSVISTAAYADTTPADVAEEAKAVQQEKGHIAKQNDNIAVNRAEKEAAKANENPVDQASQSVQIGANKAARDFHKAKKDYHEDELQEEVDDLKKGE
jgi:hypothetical protein